MLKFPATCCCHYFSENYGQSKESESVDLPLEVDQRILNPDSDSSHNTSESVDLANLDLNLYFTNLANPKNPNLNLDSMDYGCEIRLMFFYFYIRFLC